MTLPSKVYDTLKWLVIVGLPAIGTAYAGLAEILEFPYPDKVTGVIMVVCTLVGTLLGISSATYYKDLGAGIYTDGEGWDE